MKIEYLTSVHSINQLPKDNKPEIAICGRSNVGKSSFLNSVFNKKNLAKTGQTPGKTRALNFFTVEEKLQIVDLPGFGYAKVAKTERERWGKLIEDYFTKSKNLLFAIHLIDSRHPPTELDFSLRDYLLHLNIKIITILTKVDKLKTTDFNNLEGTVTKFIPELILYENLFFYSAVTGFGRQELVKIIKNIIT